MVLARKRLYADTYMVSNFFFICFLGVLKSFLMFHMETPESFM